MKLPLKWEFPGGKLKEGEPADIAIVREIKEELAMNIKVLKTLTPTDHNYGDFKIKLIPFICEIIEGEPMLIEHKQFYWEHPSCLLNYDSMSFS